MLAQRVLKFGGAALADGPAIQRVVRAIARDGGPAPVVVVSALKGVTDSLEAVVHGAARGSLEADRIRIRHRSVLAQLGLPSDLLDRYWRELLHLLEQVRLTGKVGPRELDLALSLGERMSARMVARALESAGLDATPVDAWDLGFVTDSNHGSARPLDGIHAPIRQALAEVPGVPVVTGFLAKDPRGRLTTLGRNGSDLTASVLAEALSAAELVFYKDVGGILSADPDLIPGAQRVAEVTYDEAAELAFHGARVLHPCAVAPAVRARCAVAVCGVDDPPEMGTRFQTRLRRDGAVALAGRPAVASVHLDIDQPARRAAVLCELFGGLKEAGLATGLVVADGRGITALVEAGHELDRARAALGPGTRVEEGLATLALIGHGVGREQRIGLAAHQLLAELGVEVRLAQLRARAHAQAFVVPAAERERAALALHENLLGQPVRS